MEAVTKLWVAYQVNARTKKEVSYRTLCVLGALMVGLIFMVAPDLAHAEPWDDVAQRIVDIFTGGLARTIALIAVIACGIAALVGKLAWQWVFYIVIGLTLIFGAAAIVDFFIDAAGS